MSACLRPGMRPCQIRCYSVGFTTRVKVIGLGSRLSGPGMTNFTRSRVTRSLARVRVYAIVKVWIHHGLTTVGSCTKV